MMTGLDRYDKLAFECREIARRLAFSNPQAINEKLPHIPVWDKLTKPVKTWSKSPQYFRLLADIGYAVDNKVSFSFKEVA